MKQQKIYARFFSIICVIITSALTLFAPWADLDGTLYTLPQLLLKVTKAGGPNGFVTNGDTAAFATYCITYLVAVLLILYAIYGILLILGRKVHLLCYCVYGLEFFYFTSYVIFQGHVSGYALPFTGLVMVVEFLVATYCEQSSEINRKYRLMKKREKEEKAERKRRLYFPGKYPADFSRVIRTNFKYNWKNYVLFIACGTLCSTFLTTAIGMNQLLSAVHSKESLLLGTGLQQILLRSLGLILCTSVLVTAFVFSYYIKSRMNDYRMFTLLGIRSRTLSYMIAVEYLTSLVISLICGMLLGTVIIFALRSGLARELNGYAVLGHITPKLYGLSLAAYGTILLFATAINYESYVQIRDAFGTVKTREKESYPQSFLFLLVILGVYLVFESIAGCDEASIVNILVFLFGTLFLIKGIAAYIIKWVHRSDSIYYKRVLSRIPLQYRFKKTTRYIFLLTAAHMFVLSIYLFYIGSSFVAEPVAEILPYDYVLLAHEEDQPAIDEISCTDDTKLWQYPMVRFNVKTGTSWDFVAQLVNYAPPGQYIGISESTYQELCKLRGITPQDSLKLGDHEIHLVLQQDSSYPRRNLDATPGATFEHPFLMLGRPGDPGEFEPWTVTSYEVSSLTGMLQRGNQENLLVCSDEMFDQCLSQVPGGPTNLCLINTEKGSYKQVDAVLQNITDAHSDDALFDLDIKVYYEKQELLKDITSERYSKDVLYTFVLLMFTALSLFLVYAKCSYDAEDMKRRYRLFSYTGITPKDKLRTLRMEMWPFTTLPLLISTVGAILFHLRYFEVRKYTNVQILEYLKTAGVIGLLYIAVQFLFMGWLVRMMKKQID